MWPGVWGSKEGRWTGGRTRVGGPSWAEEWWGPGPGLKPTRWEAHSRGQQWWAQQSLPWQGGGETLGEPLGASQTRGCGPWPGDQLGGSECEQSHRTVCGFESKVPAESRCAAPSGPGQQFRLRPADGERGLVAAPVWEGVRRAWRATRAAWRATRATRAARRRAVGSGSKGGPWDLSSLPSR